MELLADMFRHNWKAIELTEGSILSKNGLEVCHCFACYDEVESRILKIIVSERKLLQICL